MLTTIGLSISFRGGEQMDNERLKCQRCDIPLTANMPLEYSKHLGDVFCSPDCAMDYYFDYMGSIPIDCKDIDKEDLKRYGVKVLKGNVYLL